MHRRLSVCLALMAICRYATTNVVDEDGAMSIYRGWRPLPDDVHTQWVANKSTSKGLSDAASPPIHLRRAQPASVLVPRTAQWLSEIPEKLRPKALAAQFPRIANLICASWPDPAAREKYLADLLTGGRPNRKGFPPAVLRELQRLHAVHLALSGLNRSLWDESDRRD